MHIMESIGVSLRISPRGGMVSFKVDVLGRLEDIDEWSWQLFEQDHRPSFILCYSWIRLNGPLRHLHPTSSCTLDIECCCGPKYQGRAVSG